MSAGCISTFLTGTTTREATYTTSNGTANANPIIAGSDGKFTAFLQPGVVYRFRYENIPCSAGTPGATLRTIDGIAAVPVAGLNTDVSGTAGETLALADLVYLSATDGSWYRTDADATATSTTAVAVGFVTAAVASGASVTVRIAGRMTGLSLTAGEDYYVSATAAALTATPPTNARCVGRADSTTTLVLPCELGDVRLADSNGTHSLVVRTSSDLTADRLLTLVPGDAARTVTLSGDLTVSSTTSIPQTIQPGLTAVRVYTANNTWTKPAGLHSVVVWVVGGGGGGGGAATTSATEVAVGAGGAGGGTSMKRVVEASLGATEAVTVGALGAGGAAGANTGSAGGTSSFGAHASATGGAGGTGAVATTAPGWTAGAGAVGGVGSSGDANMKGNAGHRGGSMTVGRVMGGHGGSSMFGGGAEESDSSAGVAAGAYGGGGSGGSRQENLTQVAGGNGSAGVVIVYEFSN